MDKKVIIIDDVNPSGLASEVETVRRRVSEAFGGLVAAAKMGDPVAKAKLKVFGSVSNEALGIRLALMNRAQRQKYFADARHAKGDRKRRIERSERKKAKR